MSNENPLDKLSNTICYEQLELCISKWGEERGFVVPENVKEQVLKAMEEVGELASAILKGDEHEIRDAIGDIIVVLILLCDMKDYKLVECLQQSYTEIKNRKGKIINGSFVKDE